jgi:hypothetical protein
MQDDIIELFFVFFAYFVVKSFFDPVKPDACPKGEH